MAYDYSIECAQPYDNSSNHPATAKILSSTLAKIKAKSRTVSLVVLVDDITYPDRSLDFESYANWLVAQRFEPNLVATESQIIGACDELLGAINFNKLQPKLAKQLQSDDKYICQLFIAAWCLLRLGCITHPKFNKSLQSRNLINILPTGFRSDEQDSIEIIRATSFARSVEKIEYIFV